MTGAIRKNTDTGGNGIIPSDVYIPTHGNNNEITSRISDDGKGGGNSPSHSSSEGGDRDNSKSFSYTGGRGSTFKRGRNRFSGDMGTRA